MHKKLYLVLFFLCCLQSATAMHKKNFFAPFKKYINKTNKTFDKNVISGIKNKFSKLSKNSFGSLKLNSTKWKSAYAGLGSLGIGLGAWALQEEDSLPEEQALPTPLVPDEPKKVDVAGRSWDQLSSEEKNTLAHEYINNKKAFYSNSYATASDFEKEVIVHALVICIQEATKESRHSMLHILHSAYEVATERHKSLFFSAIMKYFNKEHELVDPSVYKYFTPEERKIVLHAVAEYMEHGFIYGLLSFYEPSTQEERALLLNPIIQALKQGKDVPSLPDIYVCSDAHEKKILYSAITEGIRNEYLPSQDNKNTIATVMAIYYFSSVDEQKYIRSIVCECFKKGAKNSQGLKVVLESLYRMTPQINEEAQLNLLSMIQAAPFGLFNLDNFFGMYVESNRENKDILIHSVIAALLEQKESSGVNRLIDFYLVSDREQKNILFPAFMHHLRQRKLAESDYSLLQTLYEHANKEQEENLLALIQEDGISLQLEKTCEAFSQEDHDSLFVDRINKIKDENDTSFLRSVYKFSDREQKYTLETVMVDLLCKELNIDSQIMAHTQTGGHLINNITPEYFFKIKNFCIENQQQAQVLKKIIEKEYEYAQKGYYVVHNAQPLNIFWLDFLYTKIWEAKYNTNAKNIFIRFPQDGTCSENAQLIKEQKKIHKKIMQEGNSKYIIDGSLSLFLNYAVFANSIRDGASSFHYYTGNTSARDLSIISADIFDRFNVKKMYEENKEFFDTCEKEFKELFPGGGNWLLIAIPHKEVYNNIQLVTALAFKTKTRLEKEQIGFAMNDRYEIIEAVQDELIETDNVVDILDTLKKESHKVKNSDTKEFTWTVDSFAVHRAVEKGDIEIVAFNTANPEELNNFSRKIENFLKEKLKNQFPESLYTPWQCYQMYKKNSN